MGMTGATKKRQSIGLSRVTSSKEDSMASNRVVDMAMGFQQVPDAECKLKTS